MFFKKKAKEVTWKKNGEYFSVFVNNKEVPALIPCSWAGDDLLIYLEQEDLQYLLEDHANLSDDVICTAALVASGEVILWTKQADGYYLYEKGLAVNSESEPFWIDDLFIITYKQKAYLLPDYNDIGENVLQEAILVNESDRVNWVKNDDHFFMLHKGELLDLHHTGNFCNEDLTVYVDDLQAVMILIDYRNCENYYFCEALHLADHDEFVWRKSTADGYFLIFNEKALQTNATATFHNDDGVVYSPDLDITLLLANLRKVDPAEFYQAEILSNQNNAFWSSKDKNFYLIDKGINISAEVGNHNSVIGDHLLVYHPGSNTTYFFENQQSLKDGKLREAHILSRTAQFVWKACNNQFWLWYQGKRVGECEHQFLGNDLMVMPRSLKIMVQLADFNNRQDNILRPVE